MLNTLLKVIAPAVPQVPTATVLQIQVTRVVATAALTVQAKLTKLAVMQALMQATARPAAIQVLIRAATQALTLALTQAATPRG